jgi:hypothetical protein
MLIAFGMGGWFLLVESPKMNAAKGSEGRTVMGTLIEKFEQDSGKAQAFKARIQFQDLTGRYHETVNDFDFEKWQALSQGEQMPVRFIAADPDYAYALDSMMAHRNPAVIISVCAGMFVIGTLLFVFGRVG